VFGSGAFDCWCLLLGLYPYGLLRATCLKDAVEADNLAGGWIFGLHYVAFHKATGSFTGLMHTIFTTCR
jgi:hypothetical protein